MSEPIDWDEVAERAALVQRLEAARRMDSRVEHYEHPNREAVAPIIDPALTREEWDAQQREIILANIRSLLERGWGVLAFCVAPGRHHSGDFMVSTDRFSETESIPDLRAAAALWIEKHKDD